jgi:hypothetical protein
MNPLVIAVLPLIMNAAAVPAPLEYRFDAVRSKVVVTHDGIDARAAAASFALAGDAVRTSVFGRATLAVPARASRFEIHPSTRVRLAGPEPGVLVVIEKGRLQAIFDVLAGDEQRVVSTPGALLAVRGTRYGVEVDADGTASLAVFDGVVEVIPRTGTAAPVAVNAGELCLFGPRGAPQRMPMPHGMDERSWAAHGAGMSGGAMSGSSMHGSGRSPAPRPQGGTGGMHH